MDSEFIDSLEEEFERQSKKQIRFRGRLAPRRDDFEGRKNPYGARERRRKVRRLESL